MKRLLMVSALLLTQACVYQQGDAAVRLLGILPMEGAECTLGSKPILTGSLDVSGGTYFLAALSYESSLVDPEPLELGDRTVPTVSRDIVFKEIVYTYQAEGVTMPGEEVFPIYLVIRPSDNSDGTVEGVSMLTEAARKALATLPVSLTAPVGKVFVNVQLRGNMTSGTAVSTNTITFPLTIYNTGFAPDTGACTAGGSPTAATEFTCGERGQGGRICR